MAWEADCKAVFGVGGRASWIQRQMQRRGAIDEEGWDAVMQNLCFALSSLHPTVDATGDRMFFLGELAEDGWSMADILPAAETKILMRNRLQNPVCKSGGQGGNHVEREGDKEE